MNDLKIEGTQVHVFPAETAKAQTLTDQGFFEELFIQLMTNGQETDEKAAFEKMKVPKANGKNQEEELVDLEKRAFEAYQNGFFFLPIESWTREPALSTGQQSRDATGNKSFPAGPFETAGTVETIRTVEITETTGMAKLSMEKAGEIGTAELFQQRPPSLKNWDDLSLDQISFSEREPFQTLAGESIYLKEQSLEVAKRENWLKTSVNEHPVKLINNVLKSENLMKEEQEDNQNQLLFPAQEQQPSDKIEKEKLQFSNLPVFLIQSPEKKSSSKPEFVASARTITYQHPEQLMKEVENTIQLSFHSAEKNTDHRVQIKLIPESMGKMEIHLEWHQDQVAAKIFVQEKEVKELLDQQFPKLWQGLHLSGPSLPLPEISIQLLPEQSATFQFGQEFGQRKPGAGFTFSKGSHLHSKQEQEEEPGEQLIPGLRGLSLYI